MPTQELNRRRNIDDWVEDVENEPEVVPGLRNSRKYLGQAAFALEKNVEAARRVEAQAERYRRLPAHYFAPDPYVGELFETLRAKVDREYLEKVVDALAAQLNISRSQLKTMALTEFVEKYENRKALEQLNEIYSGEPDSDDAEFLAQLKNYHSRRFSDEW